MAHVTHEELAAWRPRVEAIARRFGTRRAEFDDLVQEGWIRVWNSLEQGEFPTDQQIRNSMRNWARTLRRQTYGRSERLVEKKDELDTKAVRDDEDR